MGGSEHQSLRRTLEEHLEECSEEHGTRHTILQAGRKHVCKSSPPQEVLT
jgi:hypothetical protein